ncbi:unnamed protein product [Blepharisma stoltei]|uniref:Uncharacterized protein n=1 Tax=Blepharisma stoltei TaxID=1481888 RepID=A0AAU9J310_9CILI|nr:unnamed protein product [Blepharisma stoltei]
MVVDVSHSTSMSAFNRMGQLLYDIGLCSDWARSINRVADTFWLSLNSSHSSSSLKSSLQSNVNSMATVIEDLENVQSYLLDDFSKWSYCSNSDILVSPYIPVWLFNGDQVTMIHDNLFNTVSRFIINGHSLMAESLINSTYQEHAKFLMINGLGFTWNYFNRTMAGVADCELHRVKTTGSNIRAFLYVGLSTSGALYLILIGFIMLVSRKHDEFWTFILNNAAPSLAKLKITCIDRLITAHGVDYASETKIDVQKHIKKTIKTTIYISYIWRVTMFLTIGISYYLLLQLYLYPKCETMMINRPKFINTFNLKRSLLSRLLIFSRDAYSPYFINIFNETYDFPSSKIMIERTSKAVNDQVQELKKQDFIDLLSDELKTKIFEHEKNSTVDFTAYGIEDGVMVLVGDLVSFSHNNLSDPSVLQQLIDYSVVIQRQVGEEFDLADRDSKKLIEDQLEIIIDVMAVYSSAMCVLFLFYYLPYLNRQINKLKKFAILPTILSIESD